jgi:hypothetical protein
VRSPCPITVVIGLLLSAACSTPQRPERPAPPGSPSIAIICEHAGSHSRALLGSELEVAVWPDGRIVWAALKGQPEPGLLEARVDPSQVTALLARLADQYVLEEDSFRLSWYGPDSSYRVIQLVSGEECVRLRSWHESFEDNPNVVTVNGVGILPQGQSREELLAGATPEWERFLLVWRDVRTTVAGWIPPTGEPCAESIDPTQFR